MPGLFVNDQTINMESVDFNNIITDEFMQDFRENVFYMEASMLPDAERQMVLEDSNIEALVEKSLIGRNTMVRLSKLDDLERRTGMATIQLAKEMNHPLYAELVKIRVKEKKILRTLDKQIGPKAARVAKADQKSYLKTVPIGFMGNK